MKLLQLFVISPFLAGIAFAGGYGPQFLPPDLPAPAAASTSDDELLARQQERAFGGFAPEDMERETFDARTMSEFIAIRENTVVVPKGAILHLPEAATASVVDGIQGELLDWLSFRTRHRAEIATLEVTLEQASGAKPIDQAKLEAARRQGRMLIAVLQGNPISVHPAPAAENAG